jgi:hypothetical protein
MKITKIVSTLMVMGMMTTALIGSSSISANAAGVTLTTTSSATTVATAGNITIAYTSGAAVSTTGFIDLRIKSGYTGTPTFTINGGAATFTTTSGSGFNTYRLTPGANVAVGAVSIVIGGLTTPATQGNYSFVLATSSNDHGAAFQYVGQANVVVVTGTVYDTLSFDIRNSADTANTNVCDLLEITTAAANSCSYRLKVATNAVNGYTMSVATSGGFTNGLTSFANAAAGAAGTAIVAGTENYGVNVVGGASTTGAAVTVATPYSGSNSVSYVNTTANTLYTVAGGNAPTASGDTTNTALITHNAAVSSTTNPGVYTQTVTYTVTPSF